MPHSHTAITIHAVFSTRDRKPLIDAGLETRLYPYFAGIFRELGGKLLTANGVADHVHLLATLNATTSVAETIGKVKGSSSKWIHDTFPDRSRFSWQRGYAAFSVSESQTARVATYIDRQKIHHARFSFRDEFILLLKNHGVAPDEKYLWT